MPSISWYYHWVDGDEEDPMTCPVDVFDVSKPPHTDYVVGAIGSMITRFGIPRIIERPEGLGFVFPGPPTSHGWCLWLMAIEDD
jgi:hypothetical protein